MRGAKEPRSPLEREFGDYADRGALCGGMSGRWARNLMQAPDAPRRIQLSPNVALFDLNECRDWLRSRPREAALKPEPAQL